MHQHYIKTDEGKKVLRFLTNLDYLHYPTVRVSLEPQAVSKHTPAICDQVQQRVVDSTSLQVRPSL